jgi:hypothetical protein
MTITFPTPSTTNPFEIARRKLVEKLSAMKVPGALGSFPLASDFETLANMTREVAAIADEWLAVIGHQVRENATCTIDMRQFEGAFTGAIEGNCTWEMETAAMALREDAAEAA